LSSAEQEKGSFEIPFFIVSKALQIDPDYPEALKNLKILDRIKE
jgi:hypothetical protein